MALTKEQLELLETKLISEKVRLETELEELKQELSFGNDVDADEETDETEEYANYLAVKSVLEKKLKNVEQALSHIKDGRYNKCKKCTKEIGFELLEIEPESSLCKKCKNSA